MRWIEIYEADEDHEKQAALFPDTDADVKGLLIDPNTGLYLHNSMAVAQKYGSPYFGAVVMAARPGLFTSQIHVINRIVPAIEQNIDLQRAMKSGQMAPSFVDREGQKRPPLILGYFKDQREAAYASQQIRFAGEYYEEYVIEYLRSKYITKDLKISGSRLCAYRSCLWGVASILKLYIPKRVLMKRWHAIKAR